MYVKRKDGESIGSFLYRFSKKMQQSGILREAKKRKFRDRPETRVKRRLSAIYREAMRKETAKKKKLGLL